MNGRGNGPVTAAHNVRKPVYHSYTLIKATHPLSSSVDILSNGWGEQSLALQYT